MDFFTGYTTDRGVEAFKILGIIDPSFTKNGFTTDGAIAAYKRLKEMNESAKARGSGKPS